MPLLSRFFSAPNLLIRLSFFPLFSSRPPSDITVTLATTKIHNSVLLGAELVRILVSEGRRHVLPHARPPGISTKVPY